MIGGTARLAALVSVPELIALALDDLGRLPVPHKMQRPFVLDRYGRDLEPQAIAVALQHAKRAFRKRAKPLLAGASAPRGWNGAARLGYAQCVAAA